MSSTQSSQGRERTLKRRGFEQWRKVMLLGAFILLANAVADATLDSQIPGWLTVVVNFLGYGFLAAGFGIRMRALKEARQKAAAQPDDTSTS
jgi:hypothetical protein